MYDDIAEQFHTHCKEPLFTSAELDEWDQLFEHHAQAAVQCPQQDLTLFDSLTPHHTLVTSTDNNLVHFQTCVHVQKWRGGSSARKFNFTPGLWVAIHPDESETVQEFWIGKIIRVNHTNLLINWWWDFHAGCWHDHHSSATVSHGSVVACGFNFDPSTGLDCVTLREVYQNL
jgi:hypothetical protein